MMDDLTAVGQLAMTLVVFLTLSPLWLVALFIAGYIDGDVLVVCEPFALFWCLLIWCIVTTDGAV